MPRFAVYCDSILIGFSDRECGDPPMAVAFGRFMPAPSYATIQSQIIEASEHDGAGPVLVVREEDGEELHSTGGVFIRDFGVGDEEIEVTILGVIQPAYEALFPDHVAAYQSQFRSDG